MEFKFHQTNLLLLNVSQVVPERIKALVESCWAADPDSRPEFEEVVDKLEAICRDIKPTVTDTTPSGGGGDCCIVQ